MNEMQRIDVFMQYHRLRYGPMNTAEFVSIEIGNYINSDKYKQIKEADKYYINRSSVQKKSNDIAERSNTKIEHPVLKKLIDQEINYTLSRPFSIISENSNYSKLLNDVFDFEKRQRIKSFGSGAPRRGTGYMVFYFKEDGSPGLRVLPAINVIPYWRDIEHTEMEAFIYFYNIVEYVGTAPTTTYMAELWDGSGIQYFVKRGHAASYCIDTGRKSKATHFTIDGIGYNWTTPPIVWVKNNDEELPLQYYLKDLIDDLNWQTSITSDVLRDVAKFIWVLKNYAGEDLATFVSDLKNHLAIKVESDGGVDTIQPDLKVESVLSFIDKQRRDIVDYGYGVDTKDPELGSASGKAIYFRYMDLDTNSEHLQSELKAAFLKLKRFLDDYFFINNYGDFSEETFEIIFNTDMPVDETEIFQNAQVARNIGISLYTILSNIPWVTDVDRELERIAAEAVEMQKRDESNIEFMSGLNFPKAPLTEDGEK